MKKTQAIILLLALLLTSGCSSNAASQVPDEPSMEWDPGWGQRMRMFFQLMLMPW